MKEFYKVAKLEQCPPGRAICVWFEGKKVAIFNVDGTLYATSDECTHIGGALSDGWMKGTHVTCPLHGAIFDVTTGAILAQPAAIPLTCYQVRIEGDEIQLSS